MAKKNKNQMLINYAPGEECRVAMVEDGQLEEFHSERTGSTSFVGNVYIGRVTNVEPSIQAAFVDFGRETNGFLHVSDIHPRYFPGGDDESSEDIGRKTPRRERPPIQACLKKGQEVFVQVLKEGINTKGPTLTSYISIPGRYLVMLPDMDKVGVSRKVEDDDLRREMRKQLDVLDLPEGFGFILRTAGMGKGKMELKRDLAYLQRLWKDIEKRRKSGNKPRLLYAESDLLMRALRDFWTSEIDEIVIDNESALRRAARFMRIVSPRGTTKLLHYNQTAPLFHAFGIEEQIERTHSREVPLQGGGSLVIDETEAMIAIDVNSGKMRHHGDAETTAFKTNQLAVDEICRQLRLRDIGGLVMCDLIDMSRREHRRQIEQRFRERLKRDRAASKILPISQFGIVEMTRQRQKQSVRNTHFADCPQCSGRGMLKRPDSVADEAMRELASVLDNDRVQKVELVVSARVASSILSNKRQALARLEHNLGKQVEVRVSESIQMDRVTFYAYDQAGADVDLERLPKPKAPKGLPEWDTPKTAGGEDDWAVDSVSERAEEAPLEAIADSEDVAELPDDPIAIDEDDDEDASATGTKKKRRRRRGGRGRRRGKDRDKDAQPEDEETEAKTEPDEGAAEAAPADVPDLRGDSWDIEPAALPAAREQLASAPAETSPEDNGVASEELAEEPVDSDGAPKKKRRRRRGGRGRGKSRAARAEAEAAPEGEGEAPEPVADASADDPATEEAPEPAEPEGVADAPKKKTSRKKAKTSKASSKKTATKKSTSKKKTASKKAASKKKASSKKRSTKKTAASAASGDESPADEAPKPVVPKRSLYGKGRRKLTAAQSAAVARRED